MQLSRMDTDRALANVTSLSIFVHEGFHTSRVYVGHFRYAEEPKFRALHATLSLLHKQEKCAIRMSVGLVVAAIQVVKGNGGTLGF